MKATPSKSMQQHRQTYWSWTQEAWTMIPGNMACHAYRPHQGSHPICMCCEPLLWDLQPCCWTCVHAGWWRPR